MRHLSVIAALLFLSFPIDADAQRRVNPVKYAEEVKKILDERANLVVTAIKTQSNSYNGLADILAEAQADQLGTQIVLEALREARELQLDYAASTRTPRNWRRDLQPFLNVAQGRLINALLADLDNQDRYLSSFEGLGQDLAKTEGLARLVGALAKPQNTKEELKKWLEYGNGTKDEFNKLACTKTKAALASKKAALATATAAAKQSEVEALKSDITAIEAWIKAKGCS